MIKKFFLPNFADCRYLLVGVLLWATVAVGCLLLFPEWGPTETKPATFYRHGLLAILLGLSLGFFQKNCHYWMGGLLVILVLLAPWLANGVCNFVSENPHYQLLNVGYFEELGETASVSSSKLVCFGAILLLAMVGRGFAMPRLRLSASLEHLVVKPVVTFLSKTVDWLLALGKSMTANRSKFLIGVALALLTTKLLMDLRKALTGVSQAQSVGPLLVAFVFVTAFVVTLFALKFLVKSKWFGFKGSLTVIGFVTVVGITYWLYQSDLGLLGSWITGCIYALLLTLGLFATMKSSPQSSREGANAKPSSVLKWLPSLWSITGLSVLIATGWVAFHVDELTWLETGNWQQAVKRQRIRWRTSDALKLFGVVLNVKLQKDSPEDLLQVMAREPISQLRISGCGKLVDFKLLNIKTRSPSLHSIFIDDCELTSKQWEQLLNLQTRHFDVGRLLVENRDSKITPTSIESLYIYGGSESLLETIGVCENVGSLALRLPANSTPQSWQLAAQISKSTFVHVDIPERLPRAEYLAEATDQLTIYCRRISGEDWNRVERLLAETEVGSLSVSFEGSEVDRAIKQALIYPKRFEPKLGSEGVSMFAFEENGMGQVTGLYMPVERSSELQYYPQLRVLSFDSRWLNNIAYYSGPFVEHVELSKLKNLEALYFSPNEGLYQDDLLANQIKLKKLQIPTGDWEAGFIAEHTPDLESLLIWGIPNSATLAEILKLPKLTELTIVDLYAEFSDTGEFSDAGETGDFATPELTRSALELACKKVPQLKLKIIDPDEESTTCPEFEAYRQRLIKESKESIQAKP